MWWCHVLTICCRCINLVDWTGNVMCVTVCIKLTKQSFGDRGGGGGWGLFLLHRTVDVYPCNSSLNHKAMLCVVFYSVASRFIIHNITSTNTTCLLFTSHHVPSIQFLFPWDFLKSLHWIDFHYGIPSVWSPFTYLGYRWVNSLLVPCGKYQCCFKFSSYWC